VYKLADFESLPEIETSSRFEEESGKRGKHGGIDLTKLRISSKIRELIYLGNSEKWGYKSRSEADIAVCVSLIHANLDFDAIKSIFANPSFRIGEKYREKGNFNDAYLWRTYNNALDYIKTNRKKGNGSDKDAEGKSCGYKEEEPFEVIPVQKYEVLPFPLEVFPESVQTILTEFSKAVACPVDFLGVPLIAAAGVAIGTSREIEIKPGWIEGARVYACVVAAPGAKKSPAFNLILNPIYRIQRRMEKEYKETKELYEGSLTQYEADLMGWKNSKGSNSKPVKPEEPVMEQIVTTDSTLEAMAVLLEQNSRGILLARDEITGWVLAMDQYKNVKGADRQAWLSFWNGAPVIVNRKNRKSPIVLNDPFVGVVGGLPPDVLGDLADERGREDGLIHRILFAYPDNKQLEWVEDEVSNESLHSLCQIFEGLISLEPEDEESGDHKPVVIAFTPEGKGTWRDFIKDHYKEQADALFPDNLRGPWAKMEGYAARLALILQLLRFVWDEAKSDEVDDTSMSGAADLIDYFKSHAKRVYAQLRTTPQDKKVLSTVEWIRRQGGSVTARDVLMHRVANVRTASEAKQFLLHLQERGYGTVKEGQKKNVSFTLAQ
jgi:uncharacterized protein DUF3987